ncbi:MAG: hypothetical protein AAB879_02005 [Patescibacteria group bacterium]
MIGGKHRAPGLTLIEILIVVTLFAKATVILSQIFLSFTRMHRTIANSALLAQDMRYAMELIVRETRKKLINYDPVTGYPDDASAFSSSMLRLVDAKGNRIDISVQSSGVCLDTTVTSCLALSENGGVWNPITGKRVNVKRFGVYVRPAKDPFVVDLGTGTYLANEQPMATIHLELEYVAPDSRDNSTLETQTTVSSRIYKR